MKKPAAGLSNTARVVEALERIKRGSISDIRAAINNHGAPLTYNQISGILSKLAVRPEPSVKHNWTGRWEWTGVPYKKRPPPRRISKEEIVAVLRVINEHPNGIIKHRIILQTGIPQKAVEQITREKKEEGILQFTSNGWIVIAPFNGEGEIHGKKYKEYDRKFITEEDRSWMKKWSRANKEGRRRERIMESLNQ